MSSVPYKRPYKWGACSSVTLIFYNPESQEKIFSCQEKMPLTSFTEAPLSGSVDCCWFSFSCISQHDLLPAVFPAVPQLDRTWHLLLSVSSASWIGLSKPLPWRVLPWSHATDKTFYTLLSNPDIKQPSFQKIMKSVPNSELYNLALLLARRDDRILSWLSPIPCLTKCKGVKSNSSQWVMMKYGNLQLYHLYLKILHLIVSRTLRKWFLLPTSLPVIFMAGSIWWGVKDFQFWKRFKESRSLPPRCHSFNPPSMAFRFSKSVAGESEY